MTTPRTVDASLCSIALLLALSTSGCGGGGSATPDSPDASTAAAALPLPDTTQLSIVPLAATVTHSTTSTTANTRHVADDDVGTEALSSGPEAQALAAGTTPSFGQPALDAKPTVTAMGVSTRSTPTVLPVTTFTGRGYYVDATAGDDSNPGSISMPWKSLARTASTTLASGDAVLLKCGAVWRESLSLQGKKTALSSVVIGIYGTCTDANRPVISGVDTVSGPWTLSSSFGGKPVYVTNWAGPVDRLYWNGKPIVQARHPNYGGIGAEFSLVQKVGGATSFTLSAADTAKFNTTNLAGSTAYLRTSPWAVESAKLQSHTLADGTVTLSAATKQTIQSGEGYILEGKLAFLDAPGEWFLDSAAAKLYLYAPGGVIPSAGVTEAVTRNVGASVINATDARIEKIVFDRHAQRSLELIDAPRAQVTDVTSTGAGQIGILVDRLNTSVGSAGTRILRATVTGAGGTGIHVANANATVESSAITDTGTDGQARSDIAAIAVLDGPAAIRGNTISRSGYVGINLGRTSGVIVSGNTLSQTCKRLSDCGAIYAWGTPSAAPRTTIQSNRITAMKANTEGAVGGAPTLVAGVYQDHDTANTDVLGNMISNVSVGIMVHNSSNNRLAGNFIWPVDASSIRVHSSNAAVDMVRGNVVENNTLYGANSLVASAAGSATFYNRTVFVQEWLHASNANALFTGVNPNVSRTNTVGSVTAQSNLLWNLVSNQSPTLLNPKQWVAISPGEQFQQAFQVNLVLPTFIGSNLILNGALTTPSAPWSYWTAPASVGGSASFGTCVGGCALFVAGSAQDNIASGALNLSSTPGDNLYMLKYKAQSLGSNPVRASVQIARDSGDWSSLGLSKWDTITANTESVSETLFTAQSAYRGRLSFSAPTGSSLRIREVSVQKVASYELIQPVSETSLLANESSVAKVIGCAESGLRTCQAQYLNGQSVAWPVSMLAGSAMPVVAADGKWLRAP